MQVLIVDDDDFALTMVQHTLERMGYDSVLAHDGEEALSILRHGEIRIMITDWDMPRMNGVDLCRAIRRDNAGSYVYVIMLTGREGAKQRMEGLYAGADDFLNKPLDPEELLLCLKQAERILALETRDVTLFALAKLAESRDSETGAHLERVQSYSRLIAQHLSPEIKASHGVDDQYIRLLYQTSPLHDLGKVCIPDAILLKPTKLSPQEYEIMKTHAFLGAQTLDAALQQFPNIPFLKMARDIAGMHHEKFDGSGYPQGLVGEQIPLCARIVALGDAYDAITSKRVYKEASSHEDAKTLILRDRGRHFDPEVVDAFMRAEKAVLLVRERFAAMESVTPPVTAIKLPAIQPFPNNGTILVVEDDPLLLAKLQELLAVTGERILSATNGAEALEMLEAHKPRLILSDWVMPGIDGVELCRRIRGGPLANDVHFIMLTAHQDKGRLLEAYDAGADDFISKPFSAEELLAHVRAGIRSAKLHDEAMRKAQGSQSLNAQLATLNSRLERLSVTDELTGLFNRRQAMIRMDECWNTSTHCAQPLAVVAIDIDHFKKINDTYGHNAGDAVLQQVASILRDSKRGSDTICRVGGEEFLIIFPAQTQAEVAVCAERCRAAIANHPFTIDGKKLAVSISLGVAGRTRDFAGYLDLLKAADDALYTAKRTGRNRVCAHGEPVPHPIPPAPGTPAAAPIDLNAVVERCSGDTAFVAAIMDKFRTQAGAEVARMATALSANQTEPLQRAAHNLKSMSAFVSAKRAADLAREIEDLTRDKRLAEITQVLDVLKAEVTLATAWITAHPIAPPAPATKP